MLANKDVRDAQDDIKAVGQMIIESLEPANFLRNVTSLSEAWSSHVSDFIEATKVDSAQTLLKVSDNLILQRPRDITYPEKHDFLQLSPGSYCLKPYIRLAREVMAKDVEVTKN
jgi:hypothetical protein